MSTAPVLPSNWIYSSQQFASVSNAMGENWVTFLPLKDTYNSKALSNPIKITIDSNDAFARLPRHVLSATVQAYNADNSPNTTNVLTSLGLAAVIKRIIVRVGGKIVEDVIDYPRLCKLLYKRYPATKQAYLKYFEGYNSTNMFANGGLAHVAHNIVLGTFHPLQNQPFPLPMLPNQAMELEIYLNDASNVFVAGASGSYYTVSNVQFKTQMVSPDASFSQAAFSGIASGKALTYDFVKVSQTINSCSGGTNQQILLPLANSRSIIGFSHTFVADSDLSDNTKDKALIDTPANLVSYRYQIGQFRLPLTNDFTLAEAPLIGLLSQTPDYSDVGFDFVKFFTQEFSIDYSFESGDELPNSGLNLLGSDGLVKLLTFHSSPVPTTTSVVTTIFENKSIILGREVDVA